MKNISFQRKRFITVIDLLKYTSTYYIYIYILNALSRAAAVSFLLDIKGMDGEGLIKLRYRWAHRKLHFRHHVLL